MQSANLKLHVVNYTLWQYISIRIIKVVVSWRIIDVSFLSMIHVYMNITYVDYTLEIVPSDSIYRFALQRSLYHDE